MQLNKHKLLIFLILLLQVWKQRGEEYRVTGGQGWAWMRSTRRSNYTPQDTVGLRAAAKKLQNRKLRLTASGHQGFPLTGFKLSANHYGVTLQILTEAL